MGLWAWHKRRWFRKLDEGQSQRSPTQERNRKAVLRTVGVLLFIVAAWRLSSPGMIFALLFVGAALMTFHGAD